MQHVLVTKHYWDGAFWFLSLSRSLFPSFTGFFGRCLSQHLQLLTFRSFFFLFLFYSDRMRECVCYENGAEEYTVSVYVLHVPV